MRRSIFILLCFVLFGALSMYPQRRMTPLETADTRTQSVNENPRDTSEITDPSQRPNLIRMQDERGNLVYVDTVTGKEYVDSTEIKKALSRQYPLFHALTVGLNIWDPVMRLFGQDHGTAEVWAELSLRNRFKPVVEFGLGTASHTPDTGGYTYKSGLSPYFRIGLNYNFLYKSVPDYQFFAGLRYGFSSFSYEINDITLSSGYWNESSALSIPSQNSTVGYFEIVLGLKVKIYRGLYLGWSFKFHSILHETKDNPYGDPWYIPGFGSRESNISGAFSIMYTLPFGSGKAARSDVAAPDDSLVEPLSGSPAPQD